jgi:hypothetical protein
MERSCLSVEFAVKLEGGQGVPCVRYDEGLKYVVQILFWSANPLYYVTRKFNFIVSLKISLSCYSCCIVHGLILWVDNRGIVGQFTARERYFSSFQTVDPHSVPHPASHSIYSGPLFP